MRSSFIIIFRIAKLPHISETLVFGLVVRAKPLPEVGSVAVVVLALLDPGVASGTLKGGCHESS